LFADSFNQYAVAYICPFIPIITHASLLMKKPAFHAAHHPHDPNLSFDRLLNLFRRRFALIFAGHGQAAQHGELLDLNPKASHL